MRGDATLQVRVARKVLEAADICSFELVATDGRTLPAFSAGSHIDVQLPNGLTRQYSLCNDSAEDHCYLIGVLRDAAGRGGSRAMHDLVNEGDELTISAPKNHFPLAQSAHHSLLMAGGIGITPLLCMAERLASIGQSFQLHYCTRTRERTAFLDRIRRGSLAEMTRLHFDDGPIGQKFDMVAALADPRPGMHLYVCGPKGFMNAVLETARSRGWPEAQIHYEFFSAEPAKPASDSSFTVKLASSGRIVLVREDQSVVQALEAAGVEVITSCGQGVCGTCLTRVLEGECDHRDLYLTPEEQAEHSQFTPCCSRARSAQLVLDL